MQSYSCCARKRCSSVAVTVHIEGVRELQKQIDELTKALSADTVEPVLLRAAQTVAEEARRRAPKGPGSKKHGPGGVLRRSIVAKTLRRYGTGDPAPSIAAVDRALAPHAHLVEHGTWGNRIGKKITKGERDYRGRNFGVMPAFRFMRTAWHSKKAQVLRQIVRDLGSLIDRAIS